MTDDESATIIRKALNPHAQSTTNIATWRKHLGRSQHLEYLAKYYPGEISRADLFRLAARAGGTQDIDDILKLFIGAMLWGFGTVGYGPWSIKLEYSLL